MLFICILQEFIEDGNMKTPLGGMPYPKASTSLTSLKSCLGGWHTRNPSTEVLTLTISLSVAQFHGGFLF